MELFTVTLKTPTICHATFVHGNFLFFHVLSHFKLILWMMQQLSWMTWFFLCWWSSMRPQTPQETLRWEKIELVVIQNVKPMVFLGFLMDVIINRLLSITIVITLFMFGICMHNISMMITTYSFPHQGIIVFC